MALQAIILDDRVSGELDGVLIVPVELTEPVVTAALEKARAEQSVRRDIEAGLSATAAFDGVAFYEESYRYDIIT